MKHLAASGVSRDLRDVIDLVTEAVKEAVMERTESLRVKTRKEHAFAR